VERRRGQSTFNRKIMLHSLAAMLRLRRRLLFERHLTRR